MKRVSLLMVIAVVGAALVAFAGALTEAEREFGLEHLEKSRQGLLDATRGLSEAQWNFKESPERWSVAEIVEHLALSEDALRRLIVEQVMKTPALTEPRADVEETDAQVVSRVGDRSRRFRAPQEVRPTGRFGSPQETLKYFLDTRAKTLALLKTTPGLRAHALEAPVGMKLDAYQWILYISAHTVRHTKQLEEVKSDPNFPKE